jgi:hypothetical protein
MITNSWSKYTAGSYPGFNAGRPGPVAFDDFTAEKKTQFLK